MQFNDKKKNDGKVINQFINKYRHQGKKFYEPTIEGISNTDRRISEHALKPYETRNLS